jgi:hypothetical protein
MSKQKAFMTTEPDSQYWVVRTQRISENSVCFNDLNRRIRAVNEVTAEFVNVLYS